MKPCDTPARARAEAQAASVHFAGRQRGRILAALAEVEPFGLTADDLEARLYMSGNSVRPRLVELAEEGAVRRTTDTRRTRSGRLAILWRLP